MRSHPMWVRGLKQILSFLFFIVFCVAPHVGAWIETQCSNYGDYGLKVAPHVGAWIETYYCRG